MKKKKQFVFSNCS